MGESYEKTRARRNRTPLNVKFASKMGRGKEPAGGKDHCPVCEEGICWQVGLDGGLIAFDYTARCLHRHQLPTSGDEERRRTNREMVKAGRFASRYAKYQNNPRQSRMIGRERPGAQKGAGHG